MDEFTDPLSAITTDFVRRCRDRLPKWRIIEHRIGRDRLIFDIKHQIAIKKIAVPCGFNIPEGFDNNVGLEEIDDPEGKPIKIWRKKSAGRSINHAMLVVGYNDRIGPNGALEVLNSYGSNFGNKGFVWIDTNFFAETGEDPTNAMDNPCCVFAFAIERGTASDSTIELAAMTRAVLRGESEAWVRVVDREQIANFILPDGGAENIRKGDVLTVAPGAGEIFLRSNLDAVWGNNSIQTTISPQIGSITSKRSDAIRVSEVTCMTLGKEDSKEYWIKGSIIKDR